MFGQHCVGMVCCVATTHGVRCARDSSTLEAATSMRGCASATLVLWDHPGACKCLSECPACRAEHGCALRRRLL